MRHYVSGLARLEAEAPPPRTVSPEIGDKVRFTPSGFLTGYGGPKWTPDGFAPVEVTGEIVEVHEEHRWYRVRYEAFGAVMHECFKY